MVFHFSTSSGVNTRKSIGIGYACPAGEHDINAMLAKMAGNKCAEFANCHFANRFHRDFPVRLGLRLTISNGFLISSG